MLLGMSEMLFTMPLMASLRFTGSLTPSTVSRVLNEMKSCWFSSIYRFSSSVECLRAKESGSTPSGSSSTLMFMPSCSSMSVPRMAAWMPASSPSYNKVMFCVKRRSSLIW